MTILALTLDHFTVRRGEALLCSSVCLQLKTGQVCHLLGANGTGKTTLLMQLAGLLPSCTRQVSAADQAGLPQRPLYVSHQLGMHPKLSVAQNLRFLLALYDIKPSQAQLAEALAAVGLMGFESIACDQLSAGQTRRANLARLWLMPVHTAALWLLDEPFTALDTAMIDALQTQIRAFADQGGAVLMSSHQPVHMADVRLDLTEYGP